MWAGARALSAACRVSRVQAARGIGMRGAATSASARMCCPLTHTWVQAVEQEGAGTLCRVGLTARALEDIGDVTAAHSHAQVGGTLSDGGPLLSFDWDSFQISNGDELYHTSWATLSSSTEVATPAALGGGTVVAARMPSQRAGAATVVLDEEKWMLEVHTDAAVSLAGAGLLEEEAYEQHVREHVGEGIFGEGGMGYS